MTITRTIPIAALPLVAAVFSTACGVTGRGDRSATVSDIELTYKRDPRMVDPYRGLGPWVAGPAYSGATAQDKVETQARALDDKGREVRTRLQWTSSDPQMVSVSPSQGDHVTIAMHRDGESRLQIRAGRFTKELTVRAKHEGTFIVVELAPSAAANPPGSAAAEISPALKGKREQVSYAVGLNLAKTLQKQSVEIDPDLVRQGFKDALSGGATLMSEERAHLLLIGVETEINVTEADIARKRLAERNRAQGEQFLADNRHKPGVVALPSGLQYRVISEGRGRRPTLEDVAVCHYRGLFLDGTEFDSSYRTKSHEPVRFPVKGIIKGWQEALQLMPAGSKWMLFVPPSLAYGERGAPRSHIGPNTTLAFEVELLSVEPAATLQRQPTAKNANTELPPELIGQLKRAIRGRMAEETPR